MAAPSSPDRRDGSRSHAAGTARREARHDVHDSDRSRTVERS